MMRPGRYPRLVIDMPDGGGQVAMVLDGKNPMARVFALAPFIPHAAVWSVQPARGVAAELPGGEASPTGR